MLHRNPLVALVLLLAGCQAPTNQQSLVTELDGPLAQMQIDSRQLYTRLQKLTVDKSCHQDQQCAVIGLGQRACGGPEQFLSYSLAKTDQKLLEYTAERYRKVKQEQNQRTGTYSICQQLILPQAACQLGKCVLVE